MKKEIISFVDEPRTRTAMVQVAAGTDETGAPVYEQQEQVVAAWTERRQVTTLVDMTAEEITAFEAERAPSIATYQAAIEGHLEAVAKARGYEGQLSLASYAGSTNPAWAAEAAAFVAGRDAIWAHALALLDAVQAGTQAPPTIAAFVAGLPAVAWP